MNAGMSKDGTLPSYAPPLPDLPTSFYGPIAQEETVLDVPIPSASSTAVLRVQLPPQFPDHAPGAFLLMSRATSTVIIKER